MNSDAASPAFTARWARPLAISSSVKLCSNLEDGRWEAA
jgi:hypothetical protein